MQTETTKSEVTQNTEITSNNSTHTAQHDDVSRSGRSETDGDLALSTRIIRTKPDGYALTTPTRLVWRILKKALIKATDKEPSMLGMSYNSARDELFFTDVSNNVLRSLCVRVTELSAVDLRDVYTGAVHEFVMSVCYMSDLDILLMCSHGKAPPPDQKDVNWLVALKRNGDGDEWHVVHRVQTEKVGKICCALSGSRVLIGHDHSTYMELFRVNNVDGSLHIESVQKIQVPQLYMKFSAISDSETLVAMSFYDDSLRVHRLRGATLEELAQMQCNKPDEVLWLSNQRLVATEHSTSRRAHIVNELEFEESRSGARLEQKRVLFDHKERVEVRSWCAIRDGLLIFDRNSRNLQNYSLI